MKNIYVLLVLAAVLQALVGCTQKLTPTEKLKELDEQLYNPLSQNLVTGTAYNRLVYQNQVAIGGINIQEGRILGANATIDDKGATLNIGTGTFKRSNHFKPPRIALQGTIKGTAKDGLITLFSGGEYQKTLGIGGGGLFFLPRGPEALFNRAPSVYRERTKKDLQWQYQQKREAEKKTWNDPYIPLIRSTWRDSSLAAVKLFLSKWDSLQTWSGGNWSARYYSDSLTPSERNDIASQRFMRDYLDAEHRVFVLLPNKWDIYTQEQENQYVSDTLRWLTHVVASGCKVVEADSEPAELGEESNQGQGYAGISWTKLEAPGEHRYIDWLLAKQWQIKIAEPRQQASIARYDSLLDAARWESLYFSWFSVSGLWNTIQQPIFNAQAGAAGFADKVRDNYVTSQLAYNWLRVGQKASWYLTGALEASYRRIFDPATLQTYEKVSWQHTGTDSVRVVDQSQLYPKDPGSQRVLSYQVGGTYYHHGLVQWGLEATFNKKWKGSDQRVLTLGVFVPVKAAETSIILMPLVRWDSQGVPKHWTVGVSLTTSIPGFVKTKPNKKKDK